MMGTAIVARLVDKWHEDPMQTRFQHCAMRYWQTSLVQASWVQPFDGWATSYLESSVMRVKLSRIWYLCLVARVMIS